MRSCPTIDCRSLVLSGHAGLRAFPDPDGGGAQHGLYHLRRPDERVVPVLTFSHDRSSHDCSSLFTRPLFTRPLFTLLMTALHMTDQPPAALWLEQYLTEERPACPSARKVSRSDNKNVQDCFPPKMRAEINTEKVRKKFRFCPEINCPSPTLWGHTGWGWRR